MVFPRRKQMGTFLIIFRIPRANHESRRLPCSLFKTTSATFIIIARHLIHKAFRDGCPKTVVYQPSAFKTNQEPSTISVVIHRMSQYHLIYDDTCPVCLASIDKIGKLDRLGLVNLVPLTSIPDRPRCGMPAGEKLREEIHLITPERKVYRGAEAVAILASLFPSSRYLGALIMAPGIRVIARHIYRLLARHRFSIARIASLN